jgi:hypothetical protein
MMEEANREMRETDLRVRRRFAEERAERKQAQLRETFLRRVVQQLEVTDEVAEQMWAPALASVKERHAQWIDEDIEELEELIRSAEMWRVGLPDDEPGPNLGLPDPEDDADPEDLAGSPTGRAAAVGLAMVAIAHSHQA